MPKYTNVDRFKVKSGKQACPGKADNWDGQMLRILARTGEQSYVGYGLWQSEEHMVNAMP